MRLIPGLGRTGPTGVNQMQDYIALQSRHEPVALGRALIGLGLLVALLTSGLLAMS